MAYYAIFKTWGRNAHQAHIMWGWGRGGRDFARDSRFVWEVYLFHLVAIESCVDSCPQYVRGITIQVRRKHIQFLKICKQWVNILIWEITLKRFHPFSALTGRPNSCIDLKGLKCSLFTPRRQNLSFPLPITDFTCDTRRDENPSQLLSVLCGVLSKNVCCSKKPCVVLHAIG